MKFKINSGFKEKLFARDVKVGEIFSTIAHPDLYYLVPFPTVGSLDPARKQAILNIFSGDIRDRGHVVVNLRDKTLGWIDYNTHITGIYEIVETTLNRIR